MTRESAGRITVSSQASVNSMKGKLRQELLYADLDIRLVSMTTEGNMVLRITAKPKPIRLLIALLFGIPCFYLLRVALLAPLEPPFLIQAIAILCVPVMGFFAALFGFCIFEKVFDRTLQHATNSMRLFRIRIGDSEPLPEKGLVRLTSTWDFDPPCWRYRVTVADLPGFGFVISHAYQRALDFGRQVSGFLSYEFTNECDEESRR